MVPPSVAEARVESEACAWSPLELKLPPQERSDPLPVRRRSARCSTWPSDPLRHLMKHLLDMVTSSYNAELGGALRANGGAKYNIKDFTQLSASK